MLCLSPSPPVGSPDWSARFVGYTAATSTPGLPDGLAPSEAEVHGLRRGNEKLELPDGLAPSEAEVHGLASEPTSPVRGEPGGGCRGVGGVG